MREVGFVLIAACECAAQSCNRAAVRRSVATALLLAGGEDARPCACGVPQKVLLRPAFLPGPTPFSPHPTPHTEKKGKKNKLDALPLDARIAIGVVLSVLILIFGYFGLRYNLFARFRGLQPNPYHPANTAPSQHAARGF